MGDRLASLHYHEMSLVVHLILRTKGREQKICVSLFSLKISLSVAEDVPMTSKWDTGQGIPSNLEGTWRLEEREPCNCQIQGLLKSWLSNITVPKITWGTDSKWRYLPYPWKFRFGGFGVQFAQDCPGFSTKIMLPGKPVSFGLLMHHVFQRSAHLMSAWVDLCASGPQTALWQTLTWRLEVHLQFLSGRRKGYYKSDKNASDFKRFYLWEVFGSYWILGKI
jgi:hypothetical protein